MNLSEGHYSSNALKTSPKDILTHVFHLQTTCSFINIAFTRNQTRSLLSEIFHSNFSSMQLQRNSATIQPLGTTRKFPLSTAKRVFDLELKTVSETQRAILASFIAGSDMHHRLGPPEFDATSNCLKVLSSLCNAVRIQEVSLSCVNGSTVRPVQHNMFPGSMNNSPVAGISAL